MLEMFRNAAKGWVAKILLALLIASFAVWGITDVFTGFQAKDLATVGKVKVSAEQYRRDLNVELQRLGQQSGTVLSLEDARNLGLDQQVFDRVVNTAVIDSNIADMKLAVSEQSIVDDVASNPRFQNSKGEFDPAQFRSLLQQSGLDEASFLASEKRNRLRGVISQAASDGASLPRTLTEALLQYRNETRDARYFTFKVTEADVPAPTDDDLKKQYEATPTAYTAPEYRSVAVLKVEPADIATKLVISDVEITDGYDKYKLEYFTPEKRSVLQLGFPDALKAEAAKKRIDAGEDFLKIATEMGAKETDITFADRTKVDFLDAAIADAAFALQEGAVSAPVTGTLTTALIKVVKVSPEKQLTLEEAKADLTKRLQNERARDEIQSIYEAVEEARGNETKFEDIAAKAGIPFTLVPAVSVGGVDKAGADVVLPTKTELLRAVFKSDVGLEDDAISLGDGYVWYEVREIIPSALRPLADVKEQVKADFVAAKLRDLASTKAKDMIAKAGAATKLETLATENNGTISTVTAVKRNETQENFDGLASLALFSAPANSLTWSLEGDGKTARIIEVSKINSPVFEAASAEAKQVADEAKAALGADSFDVYLKSARAAADVTINEQLWRDIRGETAQP